MENKYKILVLTDLKEKSIGVLDYAVKLSKEIDANIDCFHVQKLSEIAQIENTYSVVSKIREVHKSMNKQLKTYTSPISQDNGISIKNSFVIGNVKNEIEHHIKTSQPDMIILGERLPKKFRWFRDNILNLVKENFDGVIFVATDDNTFDVNGKVSLDNLGLKNNLGKYTLKQKEKKTV